MLKPNKWQLRTVKRALKKLAATQKDMEIQMNGLQTAVLEAGGNIETRAKSPDYEFVTQYVFTKDSLERFIDIVKNEPSPISRAGG